MTAKVLQRLVGYAIVAVALVAGVVLQDGSAGSWQVALAVFGGVIVGDLGFGLWGRYKRDESHEAG